jgi:hypothetical protein
MTPAALRTHYAEQMAIYGREIGRATFLRKQRQYILAKLAHSAAKAALDEASECLTKALAAEAEADAIQTGGFVVLFDGVSAKQRVEA